MNFVRMKRVTKSRTIDRGNNIGRIGLNLQVLCVLLCLIYGR